MMRKYGSKRDEIDLYADMAQAVLWLIFTGDVDGPFTVPNYADLSEEHLSQMLSPFLEIQGTGASYDMAVEELRVQAETLRDVRLDGNDQDASEAEEYLVKTIEWATTGLRSVV